MEINKHSNKIIIETPTQTGIFTINDTFIFVMKLFNTENINYINLQINCGSNEHVLNLGPYKDTTNGGNAKKSDIILNTSILVTTSEGTKGFDNLQLLSDCLKNILKSLI